MFWTKKFQAEIKKLNEPTKEEKEFMTIFTESKNGEVVLSSHGK